MAIFKIFNVQERLERSMENHLMAMQGRAYDSFQVYKKNRENE
jgi:hypothetical protein